MTIDRPTTTLSRRPLVVFARSCALVALTGSALRAEQIQATLAGTHVEAIVSGGVTVPKSDLRPGHSSGAVSPGPNACGIHAADDRDLSTYFARNGVASAWEVQLGNWALGPGPAADFFLFEAGGNDNVTVRPRLANGTLGAPVLVSGWTPVGLAAHAGPNAGQQIFGVGLRFEDLRNAAGAPLASTQVVTALVFDSTTVDGAAFLLRAVGASSGADGDGTHSVTPATPRAGAPFELRFAGPWCSETDSNPNPFLDLRFDVHFSGPNGERLRVPGFFDGDGGAGDAGRAWVVRFTPPCAGLWTIATSFRAGAGVALSFDPFAGAPRAPLDGRAFQLFVDQVDPQAEGFQRFGTLKNQGQHHQKFLFGPWFLKISVNSPENFLAFRGFDGTIKDGTFGNMHLFEPHRSDWQPGDPTLPGRVGVDDGKGLFGALNYLSSRKLNSLFVLLMNLGGDGREVYPFINSTNTSFAKLRYDTSKLRQWETVFDHCARKEIALTLVLGETEPENEQWLDNGVLGPERKLYYREMVARFGHHQAVKWLVTEENDFSIATLNTFADHIGALDPYGHVIAIHSHPDQLSLFQNLAGNPRFQAASLQFSAPYNAGSHIEQVRTWSANAGRPMVVDADEQGPWQTGLTDSNAAEHRRQMLWDSLFSGGGVEFYLGFNDLPLGGDLTLEDFRTRDEMWRFIQYARRFFEDTQLPFWEMAPHDSLVYGETNAFGGAEVLARLGDLYAVYLPDAANVAQLDLRNAPGQFEAQWYDPRIGAFVGGVRNLGAGDRWVSLGAAPNTPSLDWVVYVRRRTDLHASSTQMSIAAGGSQELTFSPGAAFAGRPYVLYSTLSGTTPGTPVGTVLLPINIDGWTRFASLNPGASFEFTTGIVPASGSVDMRFSIDPARMVGLVGLTMHHAVLLGPPFDYASDVVELRLLP